LARAISASFEGAGVGAGSTGADGVEALSDWSVEFGVPHADRNPVNKTAKTILVTARL
jgi:hypothetical protein